MLALDAHVHHDGPFTVDDLEPYGHARVPESQQQAVERGKIMRQARSRKKRPVLLADLEKRYLRRLAITTYPAFVRCSRYCKAWRRQIGQVILARLLTCCPLAPWPTFLLRPQPC